MYTFCNFVVVISFLQKEYCFFVYFLNFHKNCVIIGHTRRKTVKSHGCQLSLVQEMSKPS